MAEYRKKSIVVEAQQYIIGESIPKGVHTDTLQPTTHIHTSSGSGVIQVHDGDWIICSEDELVDVCEPDIFKATYEKVE